MFLCLNLFGDTRSMDKYNTRLAKLFKNIFAHGQDCVYGVTICQATYWSCYEFEVSAKAYRHEGKHKQQWEQGGKIKFLSRYIYQWIVKGYANIDYEIEAKRAEEEDGASNY